MERKPTKYAIVGTGGRITMFADPLVRDYNDHARLVAFCDLSLRRMDYHKERLFRSYNYNTDGIATYHADKFEQMLEEQKPDVVIICTVDAAHSHYILKSVRYGCDVICEKPIVTEAEQCRELLRQIPETRRKVRVTFNLRWVPGLSQLRRMITDGKIGAIKHVNLEYLLDTSHGADYFRRWHSEKALSGGLLVHKSTHHFDLVNWLVDSVPATVHAMGDLVFYGKKNAIARGDGALAAYPRYAEAAGADDPFSLDLQADENLRQLYLNAESETGYIRDRNVFREGITIEDSMSVLVRYRSGVILNYSLNAYCPYEGFCIHLSGDRGRLEYEERHASHIIKGQSDEDLASEQKSPGRWRTLRHFPLFGEVEEIPVEELEGGHGGGDPLLQQQMFATDPPDDELGRNAGYEQGIASAIIGIGANASMASGLPVRIEDLVNLKPKCNQLSQLT